MRPIIQRAIAGIVKSPWVPLAYNQSAYNVGLYVIPSSGATVTVTAQYTPDDMNGVPIVGSVTRAGTVASLFAPNHGLSVGDSVAVLGSGSNTLDGTFDVASVVDANNITYTVANAGPTASAGDVKVYPFRVFTVTGLSAINTRTAGALTNPASGVRLNVTANTGGTVDFVILQGMGT